MKPFVLLATRGDDVLADEEFEAVARFGGLAQSQLERIRLEQGRFPELDLDDYSGIIVGGSPFNSSDPPEEKSSVQRRAETWISALLDEVVARDFPFLGACYGVGTLGIHQGAVVDRTRHEEVGPITVTLTDEGVADPLLADFPREFSAYVGHKEGTRVLPPNAVLLAEGSVCQVQMYRIKNNLYATQFHPELDVAGLVSRIRVYKDLGYFRPDELDTVIERITDGPVVDQAPKLLRAFVERYAR
ncbi:glutamine amidotransferase [Kocuria tytonis]|uniref:Glutamine amidotransferase n=1 Tax=Kocuria tytonis TaxID=2054280 RepID=A0A495A2H2_9MICC|nr:glutamine amidotransferase [Kocuria tytonis]RKQ33712.1 glutamine amidotransferase [Kocuria tytonis]